MAEPIIMPKLGFDMAEGTLIRWTVEIGQAIKKGDVIAEIETDKATIEIESTVEGTVLQLLAQPGEVVAVGAPIGYVGAPDEAVAGAPAPKAAPASPAAPAAEPAPSAPPAAPVEAAPQPSARIWRSAISTRNPPNFPSDAAPIAKARSRNTWPNVSLRSRTRVTQSMAFLSSGGTEALYSELTM